MRVGVRVALLSAVGVGGVLACVPSAIADNRYAAPSGAGPTPCAAAAPCSLATAVTGAVPGDRVVVTPGTYTYASNITNTNANVVIEGQPGAPRPALVSTGGRLLAIGAGSTIRGIDFQRDDVAMGVYAPFEADRAERIVSTRGGTNGYACLVLTLLADSVCRAVGTNGDAIRAVPSVGFAATVRNVTAVAPDRALDVLAQGGTVDTAVTNTVLDGGTNDLVLQGTDAPSVTLRHSSFDVTFAGPGGTIDSGASSNQNGSTSPPQFTNAAAGVFTPLATSPTRNAGTNAGVSAVDLAGNPRTSEGTADIGALEFPVPPTIPDPVAPASPAPPATVAPPNRDTAAPKAERVSLTSRGVLRVTLSESASLAIRLTRLDTGRRSGRRCVKQTRRNRRDRSCLRRTIVLSFTTSADAGGNRITLPTGDALRRGTYELRVTPRDDAGNAASVLTRRITIRR